MHILIDARKAFDSGIGTYIRCVMPRVIERLGDTRFSALIDAGDAERHNYLPQGRVRFVKISAPPLSVQEQVGLRRAIQPTDLFWATSLAHALFSRRAMICTVHDVAQLATRTSGFTDLVIKAAASVYFRSLRSTAKLMLFNSSFTESEFLRYVGAPSSASLVAPLGVESEWFTARPETQRAADERPYLVCVSNLRPHKNLVLLLRAFALVKNRIPHDLMLVGKADGFESSSNEVAQAISAVRERLVFSGFLSDPALRSCVAGADALVIPSFYEGFGLPALEGMAAGTPVIAANAAALPEICGDCASYFAVHAVNSLADALLAHTSQTPHERSQKVAQGIARAHQFNWDRTADLTAKAIAEATRILP